MLYNGSKQHLENLRKARAKGLVQIKKNKQKRIDEYNKTPIKCNWCNNILSYKEKHKKFCNSSCAASFNNSKRNGHSEETKNKISASLIGRPKPIENRVYGNKHPSWKGGKRNKNGIPIQIAICKICNEKFEWVGYGKVTRKTCSSKCKMEAIHFNKKYPNGKKKIFKYFNVHQNKIISLDSSWELEIAKLLDANDIIWIRPKSMEWIDESNKSHRYFPDFYLKEYNLYLDPKNPYCMLQDEYKMNYISSKVNIEYGDLTKVKNKILMLKYDN